MQVKKDVDGLQSSLGISGKVESKIIKAILRFNVREQIAQP